MTCNEACTGRCVYIALYCKAISLVFFSVNIYFNLMGTRRDSIDCCIFQNE